MKESNYQDEYDTLNNEDHKIQLNFENVERPGVNLI